MGAIATLFISYIFLIYHYQAYSFFVSLSFHLQPYCLNFFEDAVYSSLLQSFWCGQRITEFYYLKTLQQSGVYHILVVSGFHLSLVRKSLHFFFKRSTQAFEFCFLLLYALMTGFNPPVVRSLIEAAIPIKNPTLRILISWMGCLTLAPLWILSPSLHLSLAARIAIAISQPYRSPLATPMIVFVILFPLIVSSHPLASSLTILSTPLLTFSLLSHGFSHLLLSLFEYLNFVPLAIATDYLDYLTVTLMKNNLLLLQSLSQLYQGQKTVRLLPLSLTIFYLCGLLIGLHFLTVRALRQRQQDLKTKAPKITQKFWVPLFFILFLLTPIPIKKDRLRKPKLYKVDIPSLNHVPLAHNKHIHHIH